MRAHDARPCQAAVPSATPFPSLPYRTMPYHVLPRSYPALGYPTLLRRTTRSVLAFPHRTTLHYTHQLRTTRINHMSRVRMAEIH